MKETNSTPKSVSKRCSVCPRRERTTDDSHVDYCSVAPLISSWLIMSQQLFRTCFRWSTSSIFWWYTSCCRDTPPDRVVHGIQIRWVRMLGAFVCKNATVCFHGATYTQVTLLMTYGYFRSINKEYISTGQIFLINWFNSNLCRVH